MKNSKAVYVTKRDLKAYNRDFELYSTRVVKVGGDSEEDYELSKDFGCQYNSKRDNLMCTCRRAHRRSVKYFRSPRQVYTTQERYPGWKSFTEIGVGSVKTLAKRRTRRIHLPETDDRGVGNSDYSLFEPKKKHYETSYYDQKRTSSKCVGGVIETNTPLISKKVSPIVQTQSCATSPIDLTATSKQTIKNTDTYKINKSIVPNTDTLKRNSKIDLTEREKETPETHQTKTEAVQKTGLKSVETYTEKLHKDFSSDSLVQHVHNLENPSLDKKIRSSIDPMENKLEREYRKMFAAKDERSLTKQSIDKPISDLKSASTLRRRFEALRKGLCKKEDSKKDFDVIENTSQKSVHSRKDVSIASDPPSLEPKSYSNTKIYSPYTSFTYPYKYTPVAKKRSLKKKIDIGSNWSTDAVDSDCQGVKGMLKLWGKKFNFEEETYKKSSPKPSVSGTKKTEKNIEKIQPEKVVEEKKGGKRFLFFRKRSRDKTKQVFKAKKGVTAGRCEVEDGLTIKIGGKEYSSQTPEHNTDSNVEVYDSILRKSWLRRFLTNKVDSRRSVQIRWNNNMYATSSSTVFELLDCVYKNTDLVFKSKSDVTTGESSNYYAQNSEAVKFMQKNIQAWMIPKTIYPKYPTIDVLNNRSDDHSRNIQLTYSDRKWYIDNSCCGNKIELVLHSKNFIKTGINKSSEYILIDIPKGYFTDSATLNDRSSDEEVYKITDYESNSYTFKRNKDKMDTGDHASNEVQVEISAMDVKVVKSKITETALTASPLQMDATVQGSQIRVPKHCDVIGVGIITQREIRDIKKPILKIQDDVTDSESVPNMLPPKKCEFAESYLQDYYRHWVPLGLDLYSWCISDSHVRCSSENNSQVTLNNQGGDGSKSCPNIVDDYQTLNIVSSCNTSSCSHCYACDDGNKQDDKEKPKKDKRTFLEKILKKAGVVGPEGSRISPKDSLEVFRKRKLYACGNKSNWNACHEPCSVHSSQVKCQQQPTKECLMHPIRPKKPSKKHVSIPDCDTMACQKKSNIKVITSTGCETCNQSSACQMPPPPLNLPSNLPSPSPSTLGRPAPCLQPPCAPSPPRSPPCEPATCPDLPPEDENVYEDQEELNESGSDVEQQCDIPQDEPPPCAMPPCHPKPNVSPLSKPSSHKQRTCYPPPPCETSPCAPKTPPCHAPPNLIPIIKPTTPSRSPCFPPPKSESPVSQFPPCMRSPCVPRSPSDQSPSRTPPTQSSSCMRSPCFPRSPSESPPPKSTPRMRSPCFPPPPSISPPPKSTSRTRPPGFPVSPNESPAPKPACLQTPPAPCMPPSCIRTPRRPPACKPRTQKNVCTSPPCAPPPKAPPSPPRSPSFTSISSEIPCRPPQRKQPKPREECTTNCRLNYVSTATSPSITPVCQSPDITPPQTPPQQKSIESFASIKTCSPCTKPESPSPPSSPCRCYSQGSKCCSLGSFQKSGIKLQAVPQKKKNKDRECSPRCPKRKKLQSPPRPPATPFPPKAPEITPEMLISKFASKKRPCPSHCPFGATNIDTIRLNSKENITINMKKQTPSTEEIRENLNIKVQDEDGRTLYERVDYRKYSEKQRQNEKCTGSDRGFVPNSYRCSRIHRVSTTTCVNDNNLDKQNSDNLRSCSSLSNLIEINFTLKFKNCDKAAEINVNNCGDNTAEHATDTRSDRGHNDVYCTTLQDDRKSTDNVSSDKNDVNITILIKNYKQNEGKKTKLTCEPCSRQAVNFSENISQKFQTVATGYSEFNVENQAFDVHTAAVDLGNTLNQTESGIVHSKQLSEDLLRAEDLVLTESCPSSGEHTATDNTVSSIKNGIDYESKTDVSQKGSKDDSLKNTIEFTTDKSDTGVSITDEEKMLGNIIIVTDDQKDMKVRKLRSRKEKKEMLKRLLEKAASVKTKNKEAVKTMKEMLKSILTSDSSCQEDQSETGNELIQELTYESLKPNYFRDTDSMNNYYNLDGTISEENVNSEQNEEVLYPTKQNNSICSRDDAEPIKLEKTCMCRALAARLNVKEGGKSCCCRGGEKKDAETICDLKKDIKESIHKACIGVQTNDDPKYKQRVIATNVSTVVKIKSQEKNKNATKIAPRSIQTCIVQEMSKIMVLQSTDDDKVLKKRSKKNGKSSVRLESDGLADILQSNETKKAVLEIYAEKVISGEGTHTIAKLPKYVISRESKILDYIEVNKKLCKKETVTMDFFG